ncbi:MAG: heme NO-binding domain-containing protein [Pseudomonadota bacterium]
MHGMINRGLQFYVRDIFDVETWEDVCTTAGLAYFNFETMLTYEDDITDRIIDAIASVLGRSRPEILEDFGTYVVGEATLSAVRKLLRFGGEDYVEFLQSLEDVHDRAKIALPELEVPQFLLEARGEDRFRLHYEFHKLGFGAVFLGLLRGMADDYGALILIDHAPRRDGQIDRDTFDISLLHLGWPEAADNRDTTPELVN